MSRRAFTIIEILVVIAIIALLMGLTIGGIGALQRQAKRARTKTTMQMVSQGLNLTRATTGGAPSPCEHPLAGSSDAGGRPLFVRRGGGAIASTGMALRGVAPEDLSGGADRLLLDDDRFADPDLPFLYGMPRGSLGVIGAQLAEVTRYRLLAAPGGGARIAPDTGGNVVESTGSAAEVNRAVDYLLGSTLPELARQNAVYKPPDDLPAHRLAFGRVWSPTAAGLKPPTGCTELRVDDAWKPYRLRGKGIYDAWNREILYTLAENGTVRMASAGPDGFFRFLPGRDRIPTTPAHADAPSGGDRDAADDNVALTADL